MSDLEYTKIFSGNFLLVQRIVMILKEKEIQVIVKDESESARLAGFGASIEGLQEVYVENSVADKAIEVLESELN